MAQHVQFSVDTGVDVYFRDPKSPWQRGTNENTNGLLRQYFSKDTDMSKLTQEDLISAAHQLKGRSRQTLGRVTPSDKLAETSFLDEYPTLSVEGIRAAAGYRAARHRRRTPTPAISSVKIKTDENIPTRVIVLLERAIKMWPPCGTSISSGASDRKHRGYD